MTGDVAVVVIRVFFLQISSLEFQDQCRLQLILCLCLLITKRVLLDILFYFTPGSFKLSCLGWEYPTKENQNNLLQYSIYSSLLPFFPGVDDDFVWSFLHVAGIDGGLAW